MWKRGKQRDSETQRGDTEGFFRVRWSCWVRRSVIHEDAHTRRCLWGNDYRRDDRRCFSPDALLLKTVADTSRAKMAKERMLIRCGWCSTEGKANFARRERE